MATITRPAVTAPQARPAEWWFSAVIAAETAARLALSPPGQAR